MKFIPECLAERGLEGHLEVSPLTRGERLALAKEVSRLEDDFDKLEILEAKIKDIVHQVEIKNIAANVVHKNLDEMGMDPACDEVFTELQTNVVKGFSLGKS